MKVFGLIAHPVSHSFSQKYFEEKFQKEGIKDCSYQLFDLENIQDLMPLIESNVNLNGINISIPHKQSVIELLDTIDPLAKSIGAVNTIKIERDADKNIKLHGYNSDYYGFRNSLEVLAQNHKQALIFGDGGSAQTVKKVLHDLNITFETVSRKGSLTYKKLEPSLLKKSTLLVNTTPLGMWPEVDSFPDIQYKYIGGNHLLYDLVYNPEITSFLMRGQLQGAQIKGGLEMLKLQAEKSWEIWNT